MEGGGRPDSPVHSRRARTVAIARALLVAAFSLIIAAFAAGRARAQESELPETVGPPPPPSSWSRWTNELAVSGSFSLEYRLRHTSEATDQDLYGLLAADYGDAATQPVTAHLVARSAFDLDDGIDHTGAYAFDSLQDTYQCRLTAQLYELWVGGALSGPVASWKLGRWFLDDTPVQTYVDGARIETQEVTAAKIRLGGYAGLPSHLYESSPSGDLILGVFLEARAWTGGRTRFDYMHVDDQTLLLDHHDDLFALSQWQQVGEHVDLFGRVTWLSSESRDFEVRGNWNDPEAQLRASLSYYQLLHTQESLSYEFDPYFQSAFEYRPYREIAASAGHAFGDHFDVSGGVDFRRVTNDGDEGAFNHDFERFYVVPMLLGLPDEDTTISLTGELWVATPERITSVGGELDHALSKEVHANVGTNYSLYKYDIFQAKELDRVRTYYAGLDWKASKKLRLRIDYTYEQDPFDRYQTVRMRATWTF